MGLFRSNKKKDTKELKQDLQQKSDRPRGPFVIHLFMREKCEMPGKELMSKIMEKHLGDVDCFCHDNKIAGFAVKKYKAEFKDGSMPPQLMITDCFSTDDYKIDEITKSQMWDCPDSEEILNSCKYHVVATDVLGGAMDYKERAEMLMDYLEALVEIYPMCEAVQFQNSGKMFTKDKIIDHHIPKESRFIYFAVNVRFFNIQGTEDMIVDTLGMSTLYLPDIQYHFHDMDPNEVVNHAYNVLSYIYHNDCPIKSGETVDGTINGEMCRDIQWKCQFENSLIQPVRQVIDICMNEFASGKRD